MKTIDALVSATESLEYCEIHNQEMVEVWEAVLDELQGRLPQGSGFNAPPKLESATEDEVCISGMYENINENGMYDGVLLFRVHAEPVFGTSALRVSVEDIYYTCPEDVLDELLKYIGDVYFDVLTEDVDLPDIIRKVKNQQ